MDAMAVFPSLIYLVMVSDNRYYPNSDLKINDAKNAYLRAANKHADIVHAAEQEIDSLNVDLELLESGATAESMPFLLSPAKSSSL